MEFDANRMIQSAVEELIDLLHEGTEAEAEEPMQQLCAIASAPIHTLCHNLGSKSCTVNKRIAIILGRIASRQAVPALAALLDNKDPDQGNNAVRTAAVRALARIGGDEVLDIIEEMEVLSSTDLARQRAEALSSLRKRLQYRSLMSLERDDEGSVVSKASSEAPSISGTLSINDLGQGLVEDLVMEELKSVGAIDRFELISRISRKFGRAYLVRVRQYVNRCIYPMARIGQLRIEGDQVVWV